MIDWLIDWLIDKLINWFLVEIGAGDIELADVCTTNQSRNTSSKVKHINMFFLNNVVCSIIISRIK